MVRARVSPGRAAPRSRTRTRAWRLREHQAGRGASRRGIGACGRRRCPSRTQAAGSHSGSCTGLTRGARLRPQERPPCLANTLAGSKMGAGSGTRILSQDLGHDLGRGSDSSSAMRGRTTKPHGPAHFTYCPAMSNCRPCVATSRRCETCTSRSPRPSMRCSRHCRPWNAGSTSPATFDG